VTKSDHEFVYDETSFSFCTAYSEEGEMVPLRQVNNCQLDEIFCLNPIKTNLTERRTGANLIGHNYLGLGNGARLYD
jgi:hypothetical protein